MKKSSFMRLTGLWNFVRIGRKRSVDMKQFQPFVALILAVVLVYMLLPVQKAEAATMKNGYMSFQDAAVYVRGELAKFSPSVQVKYYFDSPERFSTREYWELLKKEVVKHTGVSDEGDYMFWTFQQVGFYAETQIEGNTHYVDLQITPMYNNSAQQEKQLEQKLDQVMASLNLTGKTDYQKVEAIYRYICENIAYSDAVLSSGADPMNPPDHLRAYYSAYGALVLKSTTCQGFSSLVYAMMLRAGIDCRLIAGDATAGILSSWTESITIWTPLGTVTGFTPESQCFIFSGEVSNSALTAGSMAKMPTKVSIKPGIISSIRNFWISIPFLFWITVKQCFPAVSWAAESAAIRLIGHSQATES